MRAHVLVAFATLAAACSNGSDGEPTPSSGGSTAVGGTTSTGTGGGAAGSGGEGGSGPTREPYSVRIDPEFDAATLSSDVALWYRRLWEAIRSPNQYVDSTELASSRDLYSYGRGLNRHVSTLIAVLRVTGDGALVNEIDRLAQLMRAELADANCDPAPPVSDGFLNWCWLYDPSETTYYGNDDHVMDDMLTHSGVAAFTHVFWANRDLDADYDERASFWIDYLRNHFEAKWRQRNDTPTGFPFLERSLYHPFQQFVRFHHYLGRMTGEQGYTDEAERVAGVLALDHYVTDTAEGQALVWPHGVSALGSDLNNCQRFYYARLTSQAMMDLGLEGMSPYGDVGFLERVSRSVSLFIHDNGATDFAGDICGNQDLGPLVAGGFPRETHDRYGITNYAEFAAWDTADRIAPIAEQVYAALESDPEHPRRIFIPAAMVFALRSAEMGLP